MVRPRRSDTAAARAVRAGPLAHAGSAPLAQRYRRRFKLDGHSGQGNHCDRGGRGGNGAGDVRDCQPPLARRSAAMQPSTTIPFTSDCELRTPTRK